MEKSEKIIETKNERDKVNEMSLEEEESEREEGHDCTQEEQGEKEERVRRSE